MPNSPNTRRRTVKGGASAFIFIAALGFAAPAQAETVTFSCEEVVGGAESRVPRNWTVDIDFSASRVSFATRAFVPAVITDREITFSYQLADGSIHASIDRLAGTITYVNRYNDFRSTEIIQGRCRRATTRI